MFGLKTLVIPTFEFALERTGKPIRKHAHVTPFI